ncbi:MAG: ATP-binding cassette domain-containing protein [Planctomycetes bacterium]|nr:ATP-binding cassette domain-containing protein [Planctomycetota bacterium]
MALLTLDAVHKRHDERILLKGVSLVIDEGTRIGIVGANGCGKSTLLRILAGIEKADAGRRTMQAGLRIGHLQQDVPLHTGTVRDAVRGGLAGREEVVARIDEVHHAMSEPGVTPDQMDALIAELMRLEARRDHMGGHDVEYLVEAMIAHVGLTDPNAPAAGLSGGEQRRVALARMLLDEPDVLLLDEPTNHLDAFVIDWLEDQLITMRIPVVMVTHDRYFLDRVVDRVIELEAGEMFGYDGGYSGYVRGKMARELADRRAEVGRQSLLRRETAWMRRGPPARTTKANARIERYHKLLDGAPEPGEGTVDFGIPAGPRLGTRVIRLRGVTLRVGDRTLVKDFDYDVGQATRLGIVGANGAGKTTLLRAMTGLRAPDAGTVEIGETVQLAAIDQLRTDLDPEATVVEEIAADGDHVRVGDRPIRIEPFLESFLFPGDRKHTQIKLLSGGERNRVLLAKLLIRGGNVLVLDEPTNDLDLPTLRALEEALLGFPGTVIVVSHDRWFLDRIATEIVHLDGKGRCLKWAGDLTSLLARVAEERREEDRRDDERDARAARAASAVPVAKAAAPLPSVPTEPARPKLRRLGNKEERELADLPGQIEAVETRIAGLDARIADPALYTGPAAERDRVLAEHRELTSDHARLFMRWEELEARRAGG